MLGPAETSRIEDDTIRRIITLDAHDDLNLIQPDGRAMGF